MTTLNKILVIVVAALVVGEGFLIFRPAAIETIREIAPGAVPGTSINGDEIGLNGTILMPKYKKLAASSGTATTTPCAFKPTATSTLLYASASFDTVSTTATRFWWGKATTAYATTTNLGTGLVAANAKATIVASSTPYVTEADSVDIAQTFGPSDWLVLGSASNNQAGGTGIYPAGDCSALFVKDRP